MACTQEPRAYTDDDVDDFVNNTDVVQQEPQQEPEPVRLPKATDIAQSTALVMPERIDMYEDATPFIPEVFRHYSEMGGEQLRLVFHNALIEFKTNVADHYETRGCIKFSLIISFLEMCSKFTPHLDDHLCSAIMLHVKSFSKSIQGVLTASVATTTGERFALYTALTQEEQFKLAEKLFPARCDCSIYETNHTPIQLALPKSNDVSQTMFRILVRYMMEDTALKAYACRVLDKLTAAINNKSIYIAHIILRYFIYTVGVLQTLIVADWRAMMISVGNVESTAIEHMGYKISTVLCGFDYLCAHMLHKQNDFDTKITNEYLRLNAKTPVRDIALESHGCALL